MMMKFDIFGNWIFMMIWGGSEKNAGKFYIGTFLIWEIFLMMEAYLYLHEQEKI